MMIYTNVIIIENDTDCKFEIGAYKCGIKFIIFYTIFLLFYSNNFLLF